MIAQALQTLSGRVGTGTQGSLLQDWVTLSASGSVLTIKISEIGVPVAKSVKSPILTQVMISWFLGSNPMSGYVLTAQSLELASDSVSFSLCPSPAPSLSLSLK